MSFFVHNCFSLFYSFLATRNKIVDFHPLFWLPLVLLVSIPPREVVLFLIFYLITRRAFCLHLRDGSLSFGAVHIFLFSTEYPLRYYF